MFRDNMKTKFIKNILFQNAYQAAVSTRNKEYPVFDIQDKTITTYQFKLRAEVLCNEYVERFKNKINNLDHIKEIETIGTKLGNKFSKILKNKRMRFGITQKMVNLYFKFLWSVGEIETPPHCPIDGVIKKQLLKLEPSIELPNWTEMELEGYEVYLQTFKELKIAEIAEWELKNWNENLK
jgi:hypothetical protein